MKKKIILILCMMLINCVYASTKLPAYLYNFTPSQPYFIKTIDLAGHDLFPLKEYTIIGVNLLRLNQPIRINDLVINNLERYDLLNADCQLTLEKFEPKNGFFSFKVLLNNIIMSTVGGKYASQDKKLAIKGNVNFNFTDKPYTYIQGKYEVINGLPTIKTMENENQIFDLVIKNNQLFLVQVQPKIPVTIDVQQASEIQ